MCGHGAPTHFYNSRGLCNICHKHIRETGGRDALEAWEQLPPEADDRSLAALEKDPRRWLQRYMGGPYAQPFVAAGASATKREAKRVFRSVVDRWYGREAVSAITYAPPTPVHEIAWSSSSDGSGDAVEAPVLTGVTSLGRLSWDKDVVTFGEELVNALPDVTRPRPRIYKAPAVFDRPRECVVLWWRPEVQVGVVVAGRIDGVSQPDVVTGLVEEAQVSAPFSYDNLEHMLMCLHCP